VEVVVVVVVVIPPSPCHAPWSSPSPCHAPWLRDIQIRFLKSV
jgi:hypothetical protein